MARNTCTYIVILVSCFLEITISLDIEGFLMTVDTEKVLNSINYSFFLCVLKNLNLEVNL